MNREQQLQFCRICNNQKFDTDQGIVCNLTGTVADFTDTCNSFQADPVLYKAEQAQKEKRRVQNLRVSSGVRFGNFILDYLFLLAFMFGFGMILAVIFPEAVSLLETENRLVDYFIGFVIGTIYYTTLEYLTGRSLAKLITRTKVVMENGDKPTFEAILMRSMCRYIPFDAFSFLGDGSKGWHDTLSNTIVISVKDE